MSLKRFLVFGYERFYPLGGGHDLISSHDDYDEAVAAAMRAAKKCRAAEEDDMGFVDVWDSDGGKLELVYTYGASP